MGIERIDQLDSETSPLITGLTVTRKPAAGDGPAKRTTWEKIKDLFRPYWKADMQDAVPQSATASGTDTYTASLSPSLLAYLSSQVFYIKFTNANTGASTLNINSLGAKAIKDQFGNALTAGQIAAGSRHALMYDGTNFQIVVSGTVGITLDSGNYTPGATGVSNVSSATTSDAQYIRVGAIVNVSGKVDVTLSGAGSYSLRLSLPVPSDFANDFQCCGTVGGVDTTDHTGYIEADPTNNEALLVGEDGGGVKYYIFQYTIIT